MWVPGTPQTGSWKNQVLDPESGAINLQRIVREACQQFMPPCRPNRRAGPDGNWWTTELDTRRRLVRHSRRRIRQATDQASRKEATKTYWEARKTLL